MTGVEVIIGVRGHTLSPESSSAPAFDSVAPVPETVLARFPGIGTKSDVDVARGANPPCTRERVRQIRAKYGIPTWRHSRGFREAQIEKLRAELSTLEDEIADLVEAWDATYDDRVAHLQAAAARRRPCMRHKGTRQLDALMDRDYGIAHTRAVAVRHGISDQGLTVAAHQWGVSARWPSPGDRHSRMCARADSVQAQLQKLVHSLGSPVHVPIHAPPQARPGHTDAAQAVLSAAEEPITIRDLARAADIPYASARNWLLRRHRTGVVERVVGRRYRLVAAVGG